MASQPDAERSLAQRLEGIRAPHPRLHFNAEGREQLRQRAAGTHSRYAQMLFEWAEQCREWSPPVELPDRALNEVVLEECGAFVTNAALAFVLSGRREHRELAVPAEPPSGLPRCHHFANQGVAILRGGWDDEAAVVSLSCGPLGGHRCAERIRAGETRSASNFSHAHADYNTLTLFARGQYFLIPPGYARRSSGFQNTVSVNGADFRVDPALDVPLLGLVEQPGLGYAIGDATAGFFPDLGVAQYLRHLVLLDGCLVVYDTLRLAATPTRAWNRFQWTLHSDPGLHWLSFDGSAATWRPQAAEAPALVLDVLEPVDFAWEIGTLQSQGGAPMLEALRVVRPEWYSERMRVLAVLSWEDAPSRPSILREEAWLGVAWPDRPERPAVGFTLAPTEPFQVRPPTEQIYGGRPLWLFG